jgi:hypothetical protein
MANARTDSSIVNRTELSRDVEVISDLPTSDATTSASPPIASTASNGMPPRKTARRWSNRREHRALTLRHITMANADGNLFSQLLM